MNSLLAYLCFAAAFASGFHPQPATLEGPRTILILRVIDGDTVEGAVLTPFTFRLKGIDTPELPTAAGKEAKAYLKTILFDRQLATAWLDGPDKFGRTLADFLVWTDGRLEWLSERMIRTGHARPYDGKGPRGPQ